MNRKLNMGMVGGGIGAFIGNVHRMAAALDNEIQLVCGAFSSNAEKSAASGKALYVAENRAYGSFEEMILEEKKLPEGVRMDFISIVTPNHMHFAPAKMAMEHGFDVVCDKPATFTMEEALELREIIRHTGRIFCLTHNYTGYPMVKEARHLVHTGALGQIRKVVAEYPQGWLSTRLEAAEQKQADWRTDPKRAGISCCMGDIGTHAENLVEYITGLKIAEVCAELSTFVDGRQLDDDGNVLVRFEGGARGIIYASQISAGEENNLSIRVYGEKGGLEWRQEEPNSLYVKWLDKPKEIRRPGMPYLSAAAAAAGRIPAGHPEGYLEAFGNLYKEFSRAYRDRFVGKYEAGKYDFPTIEDGIRGMAFVQTVVKSSQSDDKWTPFLKN